MQTSIRSGAASTASSSSSRRLTAGRPSPFSSALKAPISRNCSVHVVAKKGQKGRVGMIPGQAELIKVEPPCPEVDPDNAEFVIFIRAKDYMDEKMKVKMTVSPWVPLTIVKGGQAANFLVKAMESAWGRKLYAKTLIKNIAAACYKDKEQIEKGLKAQYPYLKGVPSSNFEYAMKIRDKSEPKDWYKADDLTMFPPETAVQATAIDAMRAFFSQESLGSMFEKA